MGNSSTFQYSVPITEKPKGESAIYRSPHFKNAFIESPHPDVKTMKDAIKYVCSKYGKNEFLGRIVREGPKESPKEYIEYLTFNEVLTLSTSIGSALVNEKLYYEPEGQPYKFVGIFSRNRPEWTIVDIACILYGLTTIPLYDTLGDQNISYVFNHTNLTTVFVNDVSLRALMKTQDMGNVKTIICFDEFASDQEEFFAEKNIKLRKYVDILQVGEHVSIDYNEKQYKVTPNDCITFSYTSGTTGPPKGAMLSHKNFVSFIGALNATPEVKFNENDVVLSYLPLPHVLERQLLYAIIYFGGKIVYFSGDMTKIKEDICLVKPTIFVSVPRLFSRFYDVINKKFGQVQGYSKTALNYGLNAKLSNVSTNGKYTHAVYDKIFFNKTKEALGGKVRLMISGSAPLLPEVHKFMKTVMCAPLHEAYGQTQSTGGAFVTLATDPQVGQIGGPIGNAEFKLVDLPEMKYTSDDVNDRGESTPRGQIWVRGPCVFLGYYKNEEKTEQAISEDGWLRSGDVGMILPKNKGLKLIDRKKNIFKLQQGEYVAAEKVENVYMKYPLAAEIFLHGESTESFAICIANFHKDALINKAKEHGIQGDYGEICKNRQLASIVLKEMNAVGKKEGLKSFEMAKNIFIEPLSFAMRGIVTNTMKIQRHEAKSYYANTIKELYGQGMLGDKKE